MKEFCIEFRKLVATWFMNWAFQIMPDCDFKTKLARFIRDNIMDF